MHNASICCGLLGERAEYIGCCGQMEPVQNERGEMTTVVWHLDAPVSYDQPVLLDPHYV